MRGEWIGGLDLVFTNPVGTGGVLGVFGMWWWRWRVDRGPESESVGWCYVCVSLDGRSWYMYIVLGGYFRILCTPNVQSLSIFASYRVFDYGRYR